MSKRSDYEDLQLRAQTLGDLLDGHHGAQVSCTDALAIARAGTRKAVRLAEEANARAATAEQKVLDRDAENVTLAKELETALGVITASSEAITVMRRVVGEHIATGLRHPATPVRMAADVLRSDLAEAGFSVDGDVMVLGALEDLR